MVARRRVTLRDLGAAAQRSLGVQRGKARVPQPKSELEETLVLQVRVAKLPSPAREHRFAKHLGREWRFDLAWPEHKVAAECEGGIHIRGRHSRAAGFIEDCRKYAAAQLEGWLVFRVTTDHINSGEAIQWLEQALMKSR